MGYTSILVYQSLQWEENQKWEKMLKKSEGGELKYLAL